MKPQRFHQIDELFQEALALAPAERSAFVRRSAAGDEDLQREVLSLLDAGQRESAFIDEPVHGGVSALMDVDVADDDELLGLAGERLGAYRLQSLIATGGMGAVYLAQRDDDQYRKQVAIKLVRRTGVGSSSSWRDDLARRFQLERQVLASLDHPNIARLIDGGTTSDGRPYFVMEHVDGKPIDLFCEEHALTIRERIELFLQVCDAVQHAHQNLVIHRDLKPGNILVGEGTEGLRDTGNEGKRGATEGEIDQKKGPPPPLAGEGRGGGRGEAAAVKLLDFGLAKILDPQQQQLSGAATVTGAFMGTFAYAAPEQVSGGAQHDTRSDVYALGLILYRLLAGRPAYAIEGTVSEVLRTITEVDPPPPSRFSRGIDDELDTIVLTALAKEQRRRYQSAGALAADLRRHLAGEPVLAKSDSRLYVLRKTVRRYRIPLAAAAVAALLVTAFAVTVTIQSRRLARRGADLAAALRVSNIDRGRLRGISGDAAFAERLIWTEHLAVERPEGDSGRVGDTLSHWALWELYAQHPCLRSARHDLASLSQIDLCLGGRALMLHASDPGPRVVDLTSGRVLLRIDRARPAPTAISPDGRVVAIADDAGIVALTEIETGEPRGRFEICGGGPARALAFVSRAEIACACETAIERRSTIDGRLLDELGHDASPVNGLRVTADGSRLLAMSETGLFIWDLERSAALGSWPASSRAPSVLAVSPDGRLAAFNSIGSDVAVVDLTTGETAVTLRGAKGFVSSLDFHPREPWLAVGSVDRTVRVWEVPGGRLLATVRGHNSPVTLARFSADGDALITAGRDGLLRLWELAPWRCVTRWKQPSTVFNARFSPDGRTIAACYGDGVTELRLIDAATGAVRRVWSGHTGDVASIAFSRDGAVVASASYDGTVRFWPVDGSAEPRVLSTDAPVNSIAFSADSRRIALARDNVEVRVLDRESGETVLEISLGADRVPSVDWSPDGRLIAMAVWPGDRVVVADAETGTRIALRGHEQRPRIVRFNADGSMLASAGDDGEVLLWSVEGTQLSQAGRLTGHQQGIFALDFSPDGTMLASGGRSGRIKLWDIATAQVLATLQGHDDIIFTLDFGPDGERLISGSRDATIGMWDLRYYDRHIAGNAPVFERR